jgi:hypothetical protein
MAAKKLGWRASALLLALSYACPMVTNSQSSSERVALEAKLQQRLQGKVAILRNFYANDELNFDSQGKLKGMSKTGPWTFFGRVEIASVQLTENSLIIKAKRNVVKWEETGSEFSNYTLNHSAHITIDLASGYGEAALVDAMDKVFLTREQRLSDIVPDYWKDLLTTERSRRAKQDQEKAQIMQAVYPAGPDVSLPKLESSSHGIQLSPSAFTDLTSDTLALSFIVDEKGDVTGVQIEKPVGLGKDDDIATTIAHWKFKPAMKDGKAVAVLMHAKRVFLPGRDRDPYHSLPCPDPRDFTC